MELSRSACTATSWNRRPLGTNPRKVTAMPFNQVQPSEDRKYDNNGDFVEFYDPPRYRDVDPRLFARGVMPMRFLTGDRFKGCSTPKHVNDVLLAEGESEMRHLSNWIYLWDYMSPGERIAVEVKFDAWKPTHAKMKKAARERVKKRRQRV